MKIPTILFAVTLGSLAAAAELAPPRADVGPQPYTLTVVSATVAPRKRDGKGWDVGDGAPDVVVEVRVIGAGNGSVRTSRADDTTSPTWNESGLVTINKGDRLVAVVVDKDVIEDDPIGTIEQQFTKAGRLTLSGTSVTSLILDVTPTKVRAGREHAELSTTP
ncbi:MAG: hypothetical protein IT372_00100 [Polyangiaceae bacterium]|nr:hypothetical protein [Polyangiaceae bacterium]